MTRALVWKLLRDVRVALPVVLALLVAYQCLWVKITQRAVTQLSPFFSTLATRAGVFQEEIEKQIFSGPGKIMQALAGGENMRFERAMDVLTIGYVHPLMLIVFAVWGVGRASSAIAGELDRGTMELLLAQPLPRWRLVLAHLIVDSITIPILALAMWGGTCMGLYLVGPFELSAEEAQQLFKDLPFKIVIDPALLQVDAYAFGRATVNVAALIFAISGFTIAISAFGRFRGRVMGWAVLGVILMFIVNVVGQMWDALAFLRPLTFLYYYQPQAIILRREWTVDLWATHRDPALPVNVIAVLLGCGAIGYLIAAWRFATRDLPAPL